MQNYVHVVAALPRGRRRGTCGTRLAPCASAMDQQPVLVVTGDPAVQQRLTRFLQTRGLPSVVADTAERAAEAVSVAGCQFTLFDHGAAVLERLKAQARDLGPIIGVAPLGHDEDLDAAIGRRLRSCAAR
jgi:hypothetical protein